MTNSFWDNANDQKDLMDGKGNVKNSFEFGSNRISIRSKIRLFMVLV